MSWTAYAIGALRTSALTIPYKKKASYPNDQKDQMAFLFLAFFWRWTSNLSHSNLKWKCRSKISLEKRPIFASNFKKFWKPRPGGRSKEMFDVRHSSSRLFYIFLCAATARIRSLLIAVSPSELSFVLIICGHRKNCREGGTKNRDRVGGKNMA